MRTKSLSQLIEELISYESLDFIRCASKSKDNIYVPYMMNDAVEAYIVLYGANISGDINEVFPYGTLIRELQNENRQGLLLRRPDESVVTVWFDKWDYNVELYQYHRIGHFWVSGEEHLRMLVYMVGTIYEKYHYVGAEYCNILEKELYQLVCFAPFRYWSPIDEDMEWRYPYNREAIEIMERLAREARDSGYVFLIKMYKLLGGKHFNTLMAKHLNKPKRAALYQLIYDKIMIASREYSVRDYGEVINGRLEERRRDIATRLKNVGFMGEYPYFHKGIKQIVAMEEHPFTIAELDYKDFSFGIRLMVSESEKSQMINAGFFEKKGKIVSEEEYGSI